MGLVELVVVTSVALTVIGAVMFIQRRRPAGPIMPPARDSAGGDAPPRGEPQTPHVRSLGASLKAKLGAVGPGQLPYAALPLRAEAPDAVSSAERWLELRATVEEDAPARQARASRAEPYACCVTLEEPGGARWQLELVGRSAWATSPDASDPVARLSAWGKIEDEERRRRFVGAFAAAMGLGMPPMIEGDAQDEGEFEVEHFGLVTVEGRRWEALRLGLGCGTIYSQWLLLDRSAGVGRLLVSADDEERPITMFGLDLSTRGLRAYESVEDVPTISGALRWVQEFMEVAGADELGDVELDGYCAGGQRLSIIALIQDKIEVRRWERLDRPPETLMSEPGDELSWARWSAEGARVCYKTTNEDGDEVLSVFDAAAGRVHHAIMVDEDDDINPWNVNVAERWPMLSIDKIIDLAEDDPDDDEHIFYKIRVVDLSGHTIWEHDTPVEVESVDHQWTDRGLHLHFRYDALRQEHWLWEPDTRHLKQVGSAADAGPLEGRPLLAVRDGYQVSFVDKLGLERGRWTPSCVEEMDALYFWSPTEHFWFGSSLVIMDDTGWSVCDATSGQVRPLYEGAEEWVSAVLACGAGWIAVSYSERGLMWARLEETGAKAAGGPDAWGGAW